MAGRGVDIILGGAPLQKELYEEVKALGGLAVIGTERHESRRIDNQLRGRSGRQGDPGFSRFYISLEDDTVTLAQRVLCSMSRLNFDLLERGVKIPDNIFDTAIETAKNMKFVILDNYGYNFLEISKLLEKAGQPPDIIFIDYIQMIDVVEGNSRYDAISRFMRDAKAFCLERKLAFVILCQINRIAKDKERPQLHHLKEAGTIEEVADLVLLLRYPDRWSSDTNISPNDYEVEVAKNKTGRIGVCKVRFIPEQMRFEDLPREIRKYEHAN